MTPPRPDGNYRYADEKECKDRHDRINRHLESTDRDVAQVMADIKQNYVLRKELELMLDLIEERYKPVVRVIYFIATGVGTALVVAGLKLIIK